MRVRRERRFLHRLVLVAIVGAVLVLGVAIGTKGRGISARRDPWPLEAELARAARSWLVPAEVRQMENPVSGGDALRNGLEHWADHCAVCHGNDGSGATEVGRSLFPPAPDMRLPATQNQTDGELFYAIELGIPLTGMPAWGNGTTAGERSSWELVLFVRHLPRITAEELTEMERFNPRSRADEERERAIEDFLKGSGGSE